MSLVSLAQQGTKKMNKRLHRVVFNAARGLRVVVQETARAAGKASGATPVFVAAALMGSTPAPAQIVANPMAPGGTRPTILVAPNGIPVINP
ncbi:ESPR domain-containing protein, partial [Variovorax sp. JS1663]|uniref:ESPR domain-containing protein n=1 Tax=Variovorax sp. JS1663 TaxID=1851577 RepID=UPI0011810578